MMPIELNAVHLQRIGRAVEAARACEIRICVDGDGDTAYVVWHDRQRHVIAAGSEQGMRRMLPVVRAEFERQRAELGTAQRVV